MDNVSLDELTAQLQAAQEKKSTVRLSERNVVELVHKLKELGIIDDTLLHTSNGKEYLTTIQLRREILELVEAHGGRISLAELASELSVDIVHCDRQSRVLVEDSNGQINLLQEELISNQYLTSFARDINERLETAGMLRIGDLAIQYGLKSDMLLSFLSAQIGVLVFGQLMNNILFTKAYLNRMQAQLRGALRGLTAPSMISAVLKVINLEETGSPEILNQLLKNLQQQGEVKGELKLTGQWVPDVYVKNQKSLTVAFYNQNGWLAVNSMKKSASGLSEDEFIQQHFSEAVKLNSVLISPSLIAAIDAEIKEALDSEKWCDVSVHVPVDFNESDLQLLMKHCPASQGHQTVHCNSTVCLLSHTFMEECKTQIEELAIQLAKDSMTQSVHGSKPVAPQNEQEELEKPSRSKKKGKSKKQQTKGVSKQGNESNMTPMIPESTLMECLMTHNPTLEDVDGLLEHLVETLMPHGLTIYKQSIEAANKMTNERRGQLKDIALKSLEQSIIKLWIHSKGIDQLETELGPTTVTLLRKHLIKTIGLEGVDWLLRYFQLQEPSVGEDMAEVLVPIPAPEQKKIIDSLPPDILPLAQEALASLKQDLPIEVLNRLDAGVQSCGIRFPKRDKKLEKAKLMEYQLVLENHVQTEENPSLVLATILPLLLLKASSSLYFVILTYLCV
eukprot:g1885.t2